MRKPPRNSPVTDLCRNMSVASAALGVFVALLVGSTLPAAIGSTVAWALLLTGTLVRKF